MGTTLAAVFRDCHIWTETWPRSSSQLWEGQGLHLWSPVWQHCHHLGECWKPQVSPQSRRLWSLIGSLGDSCAHELVEMPGCKKVFLAEEAQMQTSSKQVLDGRARLVPRAAITKYCELDGSEQQNVFPYSSVDQKSEIKIGSFWRLWGIVLPFLCPSFWWSPATLGTPWLIDSSL